MEKALELWDFVLANQYVGAAAIFLASLVAAVVVDFVVDRVFRGLCRRTATTVDDSFIDLIHRPVRISVILVGLWLVAHRLELPAGLESTTIAVLKTIAVLMWTIFAVRFVSMILTLFSRTDKLPVVDPRTSPLSVSYTHLRAHET